jgi:anti-sigma B factor antagonist
MKLLLSILVVAVAGCGLLYFFFRPTRLETRSLLRTKSVKGVTIKSVKGVTIKSVKGVTIVTFLYPQILDLAVIQELGDDLFALVEQDGRTSLVLDFRIVEFLSAAMIGNLVILDKKVKEKSGRLVLCNLTLVIKEVLAITRLDKVFEIEDSLDEAIATFQD